MRRAPAVVLNADTREQLEQLARSRSQPQRLIERTQVILRAAAGPDNDAIGAELNMSRQKLGVGAADLRNGEWTESLRKNRAEAVPFRLARASVLQSCARRWRRNRPTRRNGAER